MFQKFDNSKCFGTWVKWQSADLPASRCEPGQLRRNAPVAVCPAVCDGLSDLFVHEGPCKTYEGVGTLSQWRQEATGKNLASKVRVMFREIILTMKWKNEGRETNYGSEIAPG